MVPAMRAAWRPPPLLDRKPARNQEGPQPHILSDDQLADYAPWFDNHRRLRELITELEALSLAIAENAPR